MNWYFIPQIANFLLQEPAGENYLRAGWVFFPAIKQLRVERIGDITKGGVADEGDTIPYGE